MAPHRIAHDLDARESSLRLKSPPAFFERGWRHCTDDVERKLLRCCCEPELVEEDLTALFVELPYRIPSDAFSLGDAPESRFAPRPLPVACTRHSIHDVSDRECSIRAHIRLLRLAVLVSLEDQKRTCQSLIQTPIGSQRPL